MAWNSSEFHRHAITSVESCVICCCIIIIYRSYSFMLVDALETGGQLVNWYGHSDPLLRLWVHDSSYANITYCGLNVECKSWCLFAITSVIALKLFIQLCSLLLLLRQTSGVAQNRSSTYTAQHTDKLVFLLVHHQCKDFSFSETVTTWVKCCVQNS